MSFPILKIDSSEAKAPRAVANLLPCRVHHDGPVDTVEPFWQPTTPDSSKSSTAEPEDTKHIAHFRGRKLHGRSVKLPEGYRGVVVEKQPQPKDEAQHPVITEDQDGELTEQPPVPGSMRVTAEFDQMIIWGHESVADAATDAHVRSMEEWVHMAEKIHAFDSAGAGK